MKANSLHLTFGGETFLSKPQGHKERYKATSLEGAKKTLNHRNKMHIRKAIYINNKQIETILI